VNGTEHPCPALFCAVTFSWVDLRDDELEQSTGPTEEPITLYSLPVMIRDTRADDRDRADSKLDDLDEWLIMKSPLPWSR
jgi:hypothetical protein